MKRQRASRTANLVTHARALAHAGLSHIPDFRDPTARVFLDAKGRKTLERIEAGMRAPKPKLGVQQARVAADLLGLRTMAIDAAVRDGIARGARQLVILGAGYDGRAWRLRELQGVAVFEVDHPATQREKQVRAAELPEPIGKVTFVPVNFEKDSLDSALESAGHNRGSPTCWIWEGVVMYLTRDAMHATLRAIAARSAERSTLIVNYHAKKRRGLEALIFRLIGEPQISAWTPEEIAADLAAVGFRVREDSGMLDWNNRFAGGKAKVERAGYMRAVVAGK